MPMRDAPMSIENCDVVPRSIDITIVSNSKPLDLAVVNMKFGATTIFMAKHNVEGPYHRNPQYANSGLILKPQYYTLYHTLEKKKAAHRFIIILILGEASISLPSRYRRSKRTKLGHSPLPHCSGLSETGVKQGRFLIWPRSVRERVLTATLLEIDFAELPVVVQGISGP